MTVFNAYYKIILKKSPQIIIYIVVFICLSVFLGNTNTSLNSNVKERELNIAFINNDGDSPIVNGLKEYLNANVNIVDIPNTEKEIKDALFFREVEYIVTIPKGFTESFLDKDFNDISIEKSTIPNSTTSIYIDSIINKYFNLSKVYLNNIEGISDEEIVRLVKEDLKEESKMETTTSINEVENNKKRASYFNYMAYSLLSTLTLGICTVMTIFNNKDLKRRNYCAPVKRRNINLQIVLGNLSFSFLVWILNLSAGLIMYREFMLTTKGLLYMANSLIFTITALSISYLLANLLKSDSAISAAANIIGLGFSFLSGVFVPQAFLGEGVLRLASFTPAYWYVSANNAIATLGTYNLESMKPILLNMLIILGFGIAIFTLTLVILRQRKYSN